MDKPVRIVVGFAPGGTCRSHRPRVADKLKDTVGQPVVVDNRPGAAGRIAADAVKAAAPDGSTIMVMPIGPMAVVPHT
jgi:tripartite-type tricarboxylate transporter receptor subunit TctC